MAGSEVRIRCRRRWKPRAATWNIARSGRSRAFSASSGATGFLPLKPNWFYILLSLRGQDQHGYGIMQDVLARTSGKVRLWPATLYGTLKRLMESDRIEEPSKRPAPDTLPALGEREIAAALVVRGLVLSHIDTSQYIY